MMDIPIDKNQMYKLSKLFKAFSIPLYHTGKLEGVAWLEADSPRLHFNHVSRWFSHSLKNFVLKPFRLASALTNVSFLVI